MQKRALGKLEVSALGLGCMSRGGQHARPRFSPEARKSNQPFVDLLRDVAQRKGATPAQIALAWLLAQRP